MDPFLKNVIELLKKLPVPLFPVIIAAVVYLPTIKAPFVYDDRHAIYENPAVIGELDAGRLFTDPSAFSARPGRRMYRPLTLLSYAVTRRAAGFTMPAWHGFHIFLHCLNVLLLFFISLRLFKDKAGAFMASLLWAVHPLCSETVIYQSARSTLLATTAVLAGFLLYSSGDESVLKRLACLFFFIIGLLCKEIAIVLPALILWRDGARNEWRDMSWARYAPFAAVIVVYFAMRRFWLDVDTLLVTNPVRSAGDNMLSQAGAVVLYMKTALWPAGLSIEHDLSAISTWAPPGVPAWRWPVVALPAIGALALSGVLLRRRCVPWSLGIVWWFICLAPESSIIPLVQVANERRAYLPLAGACLAAGAGMAHLLRGGGKKNMALIAAIVVSFAALTCHRGLEWTARKTLWSSAISAAPSSIRSLHGLASAMLDGGEARRAERLYRLMVRREPRYFGARLGLGRALSKKGEYAEAEEHLRMATSLDPTSDLPWITLSDMYIHEGSATAAKKAARRAVELNDRSVKGWNNLGVALGGQGRASEALDALDRAVELDPAYAIAHLNRGHALRQLGRLDEARREYARATELAPHLQQARKALEKSSQSPLPTPPHQTPLNR